MTKLIFSPMKPDTYKAKPQDKNNFTNAINNTNNTNAVFNQDIINFETILSKTAKFPNKILNEKSKDKSTKYHTIWNFTKITQIRNQK